MLHYTNGHRRAISGASLAQLRRRMSAAERAVLAADIVNGRVVLQGLAVKAIAAWSASTSATSTALCGSPQPNGKKSTTAIAPWSRRERPRPRARAAGAGPVLQSTGKRSATPN